MRFDWRRFCEQEGIEYKEFGQGESTARGNIHIRCPFCHDNEGKFHMGLHLESGRFGCWKSNSHAGHSPEWLIVNLLHCGMAKAREYVGDQDWASDDFGELREMLGRLDERESASTRLASYELPGELFKLAERDRKCDPFFKYLESRRLPPEVGAFYGMYGARAGEFSWRVVLPFYVQGKIVGATGRHIGRSSKRYHTRPDGITDKIIFNHDRIARLEGELLVLVEGPFDAIVLDWLFEEAGLPAAAGALQGLQFGSSKRQAVVELSRGFDCTSVLLDRGEESRAMGVVEEVRAAGVRARMDQVPWNVKDPGEFRAANAAALLSSTKRPF